MTGNIKADKIVIDGGVAYGVSGLQRFTLTWNAASVICVIREADRDGAVFVAL